MSQSWEPGFWSKLGFGLLLAATSADAFYKYLGYSGIAGYMVFCIAAIFIVCRYDLVDRLSHMLTGRRAVIGAVLTFVVIGAVCLIIYPMADSGRLGDRGSDADDALIIGAQALLRGEYPFYPRTYFGNPIAPMPGSIILAIPFALKPLIVFQNIFWLCVLFWMAARVLKDRGTALTLIWFLILACPAVLQNLLTANDRLSNTIYVLAAMWLLLDLLKNDRHTEWQRIASALFLGLALSSRSNFLLLLPIFTSCLVQLAGWRAALKYTAVSIGGFILVTGTFWAYDPVGFTPFIVQREKLEQFSSTLPYASLLVTGAGLTVSLALGLRRMKPDLSTFLINCGLVQMFSVFLLSAISTAHSGHVDLYLGHVSYGVFCLVFITLAGAIILKRSSRHPRSVTVS